MKKIQISEILISENRQRRDLGDIQNMAESLKEYGLIQPIVISGKTLVVGERRLQAARLLGWTEIEAIQKDELNETERFGVELEENLRRKGLTPEEECHAVAKLYELKKEKGGTMRDLKEELGKTLGEIHDRVKLSKMMKEIPALAKAPNLHKMRKILKLAEEREVTEELIKRWTEGKKINKHFSNMDCRDYLRNKVPLESIDVVLTDPPFGIDIEKVSKHGIGAYGKIYDRPDDKEGVLELLAEVIPLIYRVMKKDSHLFIFFGAQHYKEVYELLIRTNFDVRPIPLVWYKKSPGQSLRPEKWPGAAYELFFFAHKGMKVLANTGRNDVFEFEQIRSHLKSHPLQKPIPLLREILNLSSLPGSTMLDPFAGTAFSLVAAKLSKMEYFGCEKDPTWYREGQMNLETYK